MRRSRTHLTGLHHRGQQAHVELRSGRTNVVLSAHQLDILSTGQVRAKGHCKHTQTVLHIMMMVMVISAACTHWGCCCGGRCSGYAAGRARACAGSHEDSRAPAPSAHLRMNMLIQITLICCFGSFEAWCVCFVDVATHPDRRCVALVGCKSSAASAACERNQSSPATGSTPASRLQKDRNQ